VKFTEAIRSSTMDDIVTEHAGSIMRVQLNRPSKRNAMTSAMYVTLAGIFNKAANDESTRVILWHGAGDSFCAGNDIEDFLKNPPGPGESPQASLMNALVNIDKPLVAAVQGAAIGGGTTMLTHCDFIYAGESAKFQMPFINLAIVPEFGIELFRAGADRSPSRCGVDFTGCAVRCRTRRGIWSGDRNRLRQGSP
jgi:enoyl-CoA hydratase/carnithine racemase